MQTNLDTDVGFSVQWTWGGGRGCVEVGWLAQFITLNLLESQRHRSRISTSWKKPWYVDSPFLSCLWPLSKRGFMQNIDMKLYFSRPLMPVSSSPYEWFCTRIILIQTCKVTRKWLTALCLLLSFSGHQVPIFTKFSRFGSGCFPDSFSPHKQSLDTSNYQWW